MGKYIGPSIRNKVKSGGGEVDWSKLKDVVAAREATDASINQTLSDRVKQDAKAGVNVGARETAATVEAQNSPIGVLAGVRGETIAQTRQALIDDPSLAEEAAALGVEVEGQSIGLGTGVGYSTPGSVNPAEGSPVSLINQAQERLMANPNDAQAQQAVARLGPQERTFGALDQEREAVTEPGQDRPGVESDTLAQPQILNKVRESYDMGRQVQKVTDKFDFSMNPEEVASASAKVHAHNKAKQDAKAEKIAFEENIEPSTMKEVMNMFVSNSADIKANNGRAQGALSDLMLHAVMLAGKNDLAREAKAEDKKKFKGWAAKDIDDFKDKSKQGRQAEVGGMLEKAIGVRGPKSVTNALGGFALNVVREAFPKMFDANGKLNKADFDKADSLSDMTGIILPEAKTVVRTAPKVTLEGKRKKSSKKGPNRADINKDYQDQEFVNNTIDTLEDQQHSIDQDLHDVAEQLVGVVDANGETSIDPLLKISTVENIDGDHVKGTLNNREDSSTRFKLDREGNRIVDPKDPSGTGFLTEHYLGNKVKDFKFNETMDWAKRYTGAIMYDYMSPGNGRFFVKQTEGNPQSDKLARAMLQAAQGEVIDLTGNELRDQKAGIMLKFGFTKIGANARAAKFDELAPGWLELIDGNLQVKDGQKLIDTVMEHEGWGSMSAVVEGVKLLTAVNAGHPRFVTKFYSEIDGVANGLGHNAMQAGDEEVAKRANLLGKNELDDVYVYNGKQFQSTIQSGNDQNLKTVLDLLGIGGVGFDHGLRDFSKKPVMIFGYGAGDGVIGDVAKLWMAEKLEGLSKEDRATFDEAVGSDVDKIMNTISNAMVNSVHSSFKDVKGLSELMSSLVSEAVAQGIDPYLVTFGGHAILFGYKGSTPTGTGFTDMGVESRPTQTQLKPGARIVKQPGSFDRIARPGEMDPVKRTNRRTGEKFSVLAGNLKAATQAAVIPTHNNDGINIGMTFNTMAEKYGSHVGFQIFDGVLVTPKKAAQMAKQLNQDFYDINIATSTLLRLKEALDSNDQRRFDWRKSNATKKLRRDIAAMNKKREKLLKKIRAAGVKQFYW